MDIEQVRNIIFDSKENEEDEANVEHSKDFSIRQQMIDAYDYQLLLYQSFGQLASVIGYLYGYISSVYGMQVLRNKYSPNRENLTDPDEPTLIGAKIFIIAQSVLLKVSQAQYFHYYENYSADNLNAAKSATYEIYLADFVELIAYTLSYIGIQQIYDINHKNNPSNPFIS